MPAFLVVIVLWGVEIYVFWCRDAAFIGLSDRKFTQALSASTSFKLDWPKHVPQVPHTSTPRDILLFFTWFSRHFGGFSCGFWNREAWYDPAARDFKWPPLAAHCASALNVIWTWSVCPCDVFRPIFEVVVVGIGWDFTATDGFIRSQFIRFHNTFSSIYRPLAQYTSPNGAKIEHGPTVSRNSTRRSQKYVHYLPQVQKHLCTNFRDFSSIFSGVTVEGGVGGEFWWGAGFWHDPS